MNRFRKWFESIAYAGMDAPSAPRGRRLNWLGPLARPINQYLDGGARPDDPFYLSNRTLGQRFRLALPIAAPCIIIAAGIAMAAAGYFDRHHSEIPPSPALTSEQIAAKVLPNLGKDLTVEVSHDLEVTEVHVEHGSVTTVSGFARNTTDHAIHNAQAVFDLTNSAGSRLGAVSTRIPSIGAKATVPFSFPVEQREAAFVLVREIRQD